MTIEEKAAQRDAIITNAKWQHEFWLKAWKALERKDTNSAGFYEGVLHAYQQTLKVWAEVDVECPCGTCLFMKSFNHAEKVAQNGEPAK